MLGTVKTTISETVSPTLRVGPLLSLVREMMSCEKYSDRGTHVVLKTQEGYSLQSGVKGGHPGRANA